MVKAYLVHGEEQLLCHEFIRTILPLDPLAVTHFNMRESTITEAVFEVSQGSLFSNVDKTIILKDCYFLSSEKALSESDHALLTEILDDSDATTFIFCVDKLDKRKKLTKDLLKKAEIFEGKVNRYPSKWIIDRATKKYAIKLTSAAADKMVAELGTDLYLLDSELKKVKTRFINETNITDTMLTDVLSRTFESDVFKLIEKVIYKDAEAFEILQDLFTTGTDAIAINLLIARQLRMIEQVQLAGITHSPNPLKVHPYALQKAKEQAVHYSLEEIQKKLAQVAQLDLDMKRGLVDKTIALEQQILEWL